MSHANFHVDAMHVPVQHNLSRTRALRPVVDALRVGAIGDVLMCTPALRELKRRRPNCYIRFYTDYGPLVRGLPYLDEVMPADAAPSNVAHLEYESIVPPPPDLHLSKAMGDCLGVRVTDVQPDCIIDPTLVERFNLAWRRLPRPRITVNRHASAWTRNKDWPEAHWMDFIRRLAQNAGVIEIGASGGTARDSFGDFYVDLRGRTTLEEFAAAIAACDLHVGPVSAPVHIAAAAGKRSVVIIGGYEGPSNAADYAGNVTLYTPVDCSPCWLTTPCPHGLKCLDAISPHQVENAVWVLWEEVRSAGTMGSVSS